MKLFVAALLLLCVRAVRAEEAKKPAPKPAACEKECKDKKACEGKKCDGKKADCKKCDEKKECAKDAKKG
jgi:hypothetical protein